MSNRTDSQANRWLDEQMFEEDLRAVLRMLRPNRRERLQGWSEYRTGGANFRVTISWDHDFPRPGEDENWMVPRIAEVLEAVLVGAAKNGDDLTAAEEFEMYRAVLRELTHRMAELEGCYT